MKIRTRTLDKSIGIELPDAYLAIQLGPYHRDIFFSYCC